MKIGKVVVKVMTKNGVCFYASVFN